MLGFLRGKQGELRVGYQLAARLGRWSAQRTADGDYAISAHTEELNEFWLKRQPLELRLQVGGNKKTWSWSDVQILEAGQPIRILAKGRAKK